MPHNPIVGGYRARRLTRRQVRNAILMIKEGASVWALARDLGCPQSTLSHAINRERKKDNS